ncbi:unnamed protein product [Heterosigma akashiwo]
MDSDKFPFYTGEVYHQFHDDMKDNYPQEYNDLRVFLLQQGKLKTTGCPEKIQEGAIFAI